MTRGVRVLGLQLLFELTVKDLIVLVFSLLLGMEFQNFFEALMNQETFIQHLEIESCHVQLTGLWRERQKCDDIPRAETDIPARSSIPSPLEAPRIFQPFNHFRNYDSSCLTASFPSRPP